MSKQMLELAKGLREAAHYCTELSELEKHCNDIAGKLDSMARQCSAVSEQPVAFRWKHPNEPRWKFSEANPQYPDYSPDIVQPLYTRPAPSASVRETLATAYLRGRGMVQSSIDDVREYNGQTWQNALDEVAALSPAPDPDADLPTANDVRGILGPAPATEPQTAPDLDQIALEAARKIEALNWNNPTQRTARIQCAVTEALRRSRSQTEIAPQTERAVQLEDFVRWVDCWVSNPVGSYSVHALDGLFGMTRDKIGALTRPQAETAPQPPAGYQKLPDGTRCRCPRMWQDGKGGYWCCLVSLTRPQCEGK